MENEEIACNGCKQENWCRHQMIKCCADRGVKNCGEYVEYNCATLKECIEVTRSFKSMCREAVQTRNMGN